MNYDPTQPKKFKKDCLKLIAERNLRFKIKRIGQMDRLMEIDAQGAYIPMQTSRPVVSWTRLYQYLSELPYEKKENDAQEEKAES